MKKLIFMTIAVLLTLSLIRSLRGVEPLTLRGLLYALSEVDIDFSHTVQEIAELRTKLQFPSFSGDFWSVIGDFFEWLYTVITGVLSVPIDIVRDLLDFCSSVIGFVNALLLG